MDNKLHLFLIRPKVEFEKEEDMPKWTLFALNENQAWEVLADAENILTSRIEDFYKSNFMIINLDNERRDVPRLIF